MILADTHVVLWAFQDDERLGRQAARLFEVTPPEPAIFISAITPWEIALLVQKGRYQLSKDVLIWTNEVLSAPGIRLVPLEPKIAIDSTRLPGSFHSDPADRILVATARHLGCPLLTADRAILGYAEQGHVAVIDAAL